MWSVLLAVKCITIISITDWQMTIFRARSSHFLNYFLKGILTKTSHLTTLNQNSNNNKHFSFQGECVCFLIASADTLSTSAYVYASLSSGSPGCHPIRAKSDFTKRPHRSGGLFWSRHRDALQLGDCLRSFSQQFTTSAAAQIEMPSCLIFDCRDCWAPGVGGGCKECQDAVSSYQSNKLKLIIKACVWWTSLDIRAAI